MNELEAEMITQYETQKLKESMYKELNGVTHGLWQAATILLTVIVLGVAGSVFYPSQESQSPTARIQEQFSASPSGSGAQSHAVAEKVGDTSFAAATSRVASDAH